MCLQNIKNHHDVAINHGVYDKGMSLYYMNRIYRFFIHNI